ncbi:MAG: phosphatase PAP2 family protein [Clostridia bacterium]|nr:phosphatase PAP2 family protein [Clostridia bacterium]
MRTKSKYILPAVSFILFIILIVLLKTANVQNTGIGNTKIGLYSLNLAAKEFIGTNAAWYKITKITGLLSIASGGIFALLGLWQLIKRKSLLKVDREILALGGLYILTGGIYVLFEKIIINYRPLIMEGETLPEASFPSSHTVLAVVVLGSIFILLNKYIKNKPLFYTLKSLCAALAVITVIGRMLSGVHWLTDILGGFILSVCLLSLFYAFIKE